MESTDSKYLDEYRIIKTLGQGYHAKVKLAEGPDHKLVAIKKFKTETANLETLKHELAILQQLHHENLVNLIAVRPNSTYKKRNGDTEPCFAIILEYVGGGELFDFVALGGKFSTPVSRTYFYQLMNAVHYMHERGIAHRDIKPENILLTENYVLKLTDFGFATPLQGKNKTGVLHTKLGTEGYMAPEVQTKNYQGAKADIFSCGVILFIMFTASPPFERSIPTDPYYKLLKDKNYTAFWNFHGKRRPAGFFTDEFKDLVNKMLAYDPEERPTMVQIAQHPWTKGPVLAAEALKLEFAERKRKVDDEVQKQRIEKEKKKEARNNALYGGAAVHRGEDENLDTFMQNFQEIGGKEYDLPLVKKEGFVVQEEPDYFFSSLYTLLSEKFTLDFETYEIDLTATHQTEDNKVTVTFTYKEDDESNIEQTLKLEIVVSKKSEKHLSLEFNILEGPDIYYRRLVNQIKQEFVV